MAQDVDRRPFRLEDVHRIKDVGDIAIFPDGEWIAYCVGNLDDKDDPAGKAQVWLLNRSGGEARRLTEMRSGVSGSESSPDRSKLILVSNDSEKIQEKASNNTEIDKPSHSTPKPIVIDRYQFKQDPVGYLDDKYQPDGRQIIPIRRADFARSAAPPQSADRRVAR
ncbi:MAG: hypothetical protein WD078_08755 [Woeseia sp.]